MKVKIDLIETSQCIELDAKNTYTKGPMFCVFCEDGRVQKYPIRNIWRVVEDYGNTASK